MVGTVPDAVPERVDRAALVDLALKPGQELAAGRAVFVEAQRGGGVGLGGMEETAELDEIDAVLSVVVATVAGRPADAAVSRRGLANRSARGRISGVARQFLADEALKAALGRVRRHRVTRDAGSALRWRGPDAPPRWPRRSLRH